MKIIWKTVWVLFFITSCTRQPITIEQPSIISDPQKQVVLQQTPPEQIDQTTATIKSTLQPDLLPIDSGVPVEAITENPLIYSPLHGILISELPLIISNPFIMPQIGKDDGHHGVDFSFYDFRDLGHINGLPVQSIFSGKVAAITEDYPPYGNMIIIESDFNESIINYSAEYSQNIPSVDWTISPQLTCPELPVPPQNLIDQKFSLYVLYAHLSEPSTEKFGNAIQAGDVIGTVGNSGMSGNPHLHLEFRIGPSAFPFEPMGHYSSSLSQESMKSYCIWRVSGWFIPNNPMDFFTALNSSAN